jgi:hypothetical protein
MKIAKEEKKLLNSYEIASYLFLLRREYLENNWCKFNIWPLMAMQWQ